ncbi:MAG: hypothetical protein LBP50_10845 [Tannerella sp.]|nr:hypothetical protein [Tannerella sp.]
MVFNSAFSLHVQVQTGASTGRRCGRSTGERERMYRPFSPDPENSLIRQAKLA